MRQIIEKKGIQTRTIFTGNILKQPAMRGLQHNSKKDAGKNSNISAAESRYPEPPIGAPTSESNRYVAVNPRLRGPGARFSTIYLFICK